MLTNAYIASAMLGNKLITKLFKSNKFGFLLELKEATILWLKDPKIKYG